MEHELIKSVSAQVVSTPFALISILVSVIVMTFIVSAFVYRLLRNKDISTKHFTASEKIQIQAESRELSDNQMRVAIVVVNKLKVLLTETSDRLYPNKTDLEYCFLDLLYSHIVDNLINQIRIDLVRNHIVQKTDDELKVYTRSKAEMYRMKVETYLSEYNRKVPGINTADIISGISDKTFFDLFYAIYSNAKSLSVGY